jgi:hypothetical protein
MSKTFSDDHEGTINKVIRNQNYQKYISNRISLEKEVLAKTSIGKIKVKEIKIKTNGNLLIFPSTLDD